MYMYILRWNPTRCKYCIMYLIGQFHIYKMFCRPTRFAYIYRATCIEFVLIVVTTRYSNIRGII